ncbi:30S ribosomal protein S3 [Halorubrum ezzemoulense]|uniref:Small ribosomal subunit protein uS3 n=2 Tax=Halorubrum ezzemoulense TaxID=337243 RepID=A0A256J033_HALEZ|nr:MULTISPECIES: 30S ribosomal protein S3 [Halorubrum]MDB2224370.1 30S ribosomal protein S3 [Halorubrum ezzemoulense]MDB2238305.1 30S ribosomal protein S3 [Halorubrum ezzemoulense]MDB2247774.1 30S ribosomal protein S3 [Halorubrum ezzemoulense]MDB2281109.1 30S ribosomal protein S3 [Halorubrum ezzemoulense]MDB9233830.1 30S ribosomal protein S3 [Halorubrum ezzemoulense]
MADEHQFIEDGLRRSQINEFFADELGRAGYGGMDVAQTPMGTQIVLKAEKPGMVIGKGGKNIRKITTELEDRFDMDDPQIDVQEVDEPDLNAQIVADRLANALERGWYFRKAGHTTIDRIMDAGALGAEIVLSGKVTGARSRVEKFNRGYIKHNGEPAEEVVDHGQGVAVMKLGTIGVNVKIIPPGATLPDDFQIREDAEVPEVEQAAAGAGDDEGVEALLEEDPEEVPDVGADEDVDVPDEDPADVIDEEVVEEVVEETQDTATEATDVAAEEPVGDADADELDELDEEIESEAADLVAEMEAADEEEEDE